MSAGLRCAQGDHDCERTAIQGLDKVTCGYPKYTCEGFGAVPCLPKVAGSVSELKRTRNHFFRIPVNILDTTLSLLLWVGLNEQRKQPSGPQFPCGL